MVDSKRRLGRGLDSLLPASRLQELDAAASSDAQNVHLHPSAVGSPAKDYVAELPLDMINANPHQPRQSWDQSKLTQLADSIKSNGLVQPIIVRPFADGYQLIAGERRLRACQMAGCHAIAAIVRPASEDQLLEWALVENIHRTDLNPVERARAYQQYIHRCGLTQQSAAAKLGEDRSTIANYIRLLDLPETIRRLLADGSLSMGHARALLGLSNPAEQQNFAEQIVAKAWSVRELERRIQALNRVEARQTPRKPAHILDLETQFTRSLGTKVTITPRARKPHRGQIVIEFYSLDDFDRISERLQ